MNSFTQTLNVSIGNAWLHILHSQVFPKAELVLKVQIDNNCSKADKKKNICETHHSSLSLLILNEFCFCE